MNVNKNLMLVQATINDTTNPTASKLKSFAENCPAFLSRSKPVAAAMVGTASKKENSTIVFLFNPSHSPPKIVAAERDTPGIMARD